MAERRGETFVMAESAEGPISFSTIVLGLASTTLIHLGEAANPEAGEPRLNLVMAHQSLELLDVLRAKTQGNLTADEDRLLTSILTDLRLRYVQKSRT